MSVENELGTLLKKMQDKIDNGLSAKSEEIVKIKTEMDKKLKSIELKASKVGERASVEDPAVYSRDIFSKVLRSKNFGITATDEQKEILKKSGIVVGSNPDGGYFVPDVISNEVINRLYEINPMRRLATISTIGGSELKIPTLNKLPGSTWLEERGLVSEGSIHTDMVNIPLHKLGTKMVFTKEILDDAEFDLRKYVSDQVVMDFGITEGEAHILGDGVAKPLGVLTLEKWSNAGSYTFGRLENIETGTASTLEGDDLIRLQGSLLEGFQANAIFGMTRQVWIEIMSLKDENGQYLMSPTMLFSGLTPQLLGKPVEFFPSLQTVTTGEIPVMYGDFKAGYHIVQKRGIDTVVDEVSSDRDEIHDKFYLRTGGTVQNFQAIKRLEVK